MQEKVKIGGRHYFFCEKCRRKFMFEKTHREHKCVKLEVLPPDPHPLWEMT